MEQRGVLSGKVCLVTGAGKGIGSKTVEVFAQEGAIVYANDVTEGTLDEKALFLSQKYNVAVHPVYFDVTDERAAKAAIMRIKKESKRLDVLVNNAGIMQDAVIGMISKDLVEKVFDVNVYSVISLIQLASRLMRAQKSGSIINLCSIVGVEGSAGQLVYSASKGAVRAITLAASKELASDNIRVNAVAPGMIDTNLFRSIGSKSIEKNLQNIKMGRLGTPEDVANGILFLASDLSSYITGQIIGIDGEATV